MSKYFEIGSRKLSISLIEDILIKNKKLRLSKSCIIRIKKSRKYLEDSVSDKTLIYGVNTGFGSLCNNKIPINQINKLQENLIISHACGTGEVINHEIVKIILILKIHSLCLGYSGVRLSLVNFLISLFNKSIIPVIYEQGSLGASGDLAPLAHLSLPILGKGHVIYNGRKISSKKALKKENLNPIKLSYKEGLALLNGTQFMSAFCAWSIIQSKKMSYFSDLISSISLEAFSCRHEPFTDLVSIVRPHKGQIETGKNILKILKSSKAFFSNNNYTQDPYSFRCIPQVHGATKDVINYVNNVLEIEINSVTDNPIIFQKHDKIISGGNFHGQPIAMAMDYLAISLSELGNISERRVFNLLSGERGLPNYLIQNAGINSGFMITQYTAASIVSQNKQLCTPSSVDSIVSSNGQEDHVSMGANSAIKLFKVVNNLNTILSIELMNSVQALELKKVKSSKIVMNFIKSYRKKVPFINHDVILSEYIFKGKEFILNYL